MEKFKGQSQTYVATISTVLPPRHQTATLVYSNPQQLGSGPRLAVANPIATQRQGYYLIKFNSFYPHTFSQVFRFLFLFPFSLFMIY